MLLFICFAVLVLVGIGLIVWDRQLSINIWDETWRSILGTILIIFFGSGLFVSGIIFLIHGIAPEHRFEQDMIEYEVLQYEEENGYITFAEDVVEYNQKVNSRKKWANNPWVNWYYYDGCENLPYYEFDGFEVRGE